MKKIKYKILEYLNRKINKEIAKMIAVENAELIYSDFWEFSGLSESDLR